MCRMEIAAAAPAPGASRRFAHARHPSDLLYLLTPAPGAPRRSAGARPAGEPLSLPPRRDLKLRYQDTILGFFWTALKPLLFGLVVWFALHKVLNVETDVPYHLFLLSALLPRPWL